MKTCVGIVLVAVLSVLSVCAAQEQKELRVFSGERWEYKTIQHRSDTLPEDSELNVLGDEGWEVVTVLDSGARQRSGLQILLKRKKIALVESLNPQWKDLSGDWYGPS